MGRREAIKSDKKVAIGLYYYAHGGTFFELGEKFGVGESTAHNCILEFTGEVLRKFGHKVQYPQGASLTRVMQGFASRKKLPNCVGAIDCSHIRITGPNIESKKDYYDREGNYSVVLQAVVDSEGRFLNVYAGEVGSKHDSSIFSNSPLGIKLRNKEILQGPITHVDGEAIRPYIIGDAGYKSEAFMIVPYPGSSLSPVRQKFNYLHSSTRMCVEQAFGKLKSRFRLLNGKLYIWDPAKLAKIIPCACILHNIAMDMNDTGNETEQDVEAQLPGDVSSHAVEATDMDVREILCEYLNRVVVE